MPRRLLLIWICFLIRGTFYVSLLPLWDGFDEWAHFAVIQKMSVTDRFLIDRGSWVSREIDASLSLAPLPAGMTSIPANGVTLEEYWKLSSEVRGFREEELRHLPPQWAGEYEQMGMPAYEASQSPLYYWLMRPPMTLLRNRSLLDRVWLIRMLTLVLGSLSIPIGFNLARICCESESRALAVTTVLALLPEFALTLSRVSNEALAIVCFTLFLWAVIAWLDRPSLLRAILVGISLGGGLLSKAYMLTALPAFVLVCIHAAEKKFGDRKLVVRQAILALIIAASISAWWYLRAYLQTGTVSGLDEALMLRDVTFSTKLHAMLQVRWWSALTTILTSHIWYGGWNLRALPKWLYLPWLGSMAIALCGIIRMVLLKKNRVGFLLLSFYGFFWIGQIWQVMMLFLSKGSSTGVGGWYLYSIIWAELILAAIGITALVPRRFLRRCYFGILIGVAFTDIYGINSVLIPYYSGSESLLKVDFNRIAVNHPDFLSVSTLLVLWTGYVLATGALVVLAGHIVEERYRHPA